MNRMKAKKYHIGILSLAVCISCMAKTSVLVGPTFEKPYTVFENEETGMVYTVQENLVGKVDWVRMMDNGGIHLVFTGILKIHVSMRQYLGTDAVVRQPVTLKYYVRELFIHISGWPGSELF